MVQDTSPQHRPIALPVACKHPLHLPLCTCRLPFHHCCHHNHHHLNASTTSATSLAPSPYNWHHFATQTGGAKGALAPTISARPPFAHPPPLCRLFHLHGCSHCTLWFTHPAPSCPAPPHPTCCPPLHARGCRRDSVPLVPSAQAMPHARGRATCKGKGHAQGEGEGPGGMCARGRAACKGRGRVCEQVSKQGCT